MGPPSLLQSVPNYSLTSTKWSLIIVAVSRTCLQGSLHSWSGPYQKCNHLSSLPLQWCSHEMTQGSDTISTATSSLYVLHMVDSPLKSFHVHGTLHRGFSSQQEADFFGTIFCHSGSWGALPWDSKTSHGFCGKVTSASCYNPSLPGTQRWVHMNWAKKGPFIWDHHLRQSSSFFLPSTPT